MRKNPEGERQRRGEQKKIEKGHEPGGTESKLREPEDEQHRRTRTKKNINTDTERQIQKENRRPKKVKDEKKQMREFLFGQQPHAFIIVLDLQQPGKFFIPPSFTIIIA
jgi:hypothetical protein